MRVWGRGATIVSALVFLNTEIPWIPNHRAQVVTPTELFGAFCHAELEGETLENSGRLWKKMARKKEESRLEEKTLSF